MDEYNPRSSKAKNSALHPRCTDYINMFKSGNRMMSTPAEMASLIDEWMAKYNYEKIFLATEDKDILNWMRDHYKESWATSQERQRHRFRTSSFSPTSISRASGNTISTRSSRKILVNYVALYMLSQCHGFVCSGYCNGFDLVLHFNQGKFEHVHLFQKGEA